MSGFSDSTNCPNCGGDADRYSDYKPFDMVDITCINCGFLTITTVKQMGLDEVNEMRLDRELAELKELPKWKLDEWGFYIKEEEKK